MLSLQRLSCIRLDRNTDTVQPGYGQMLSQMLSFPTVLLLLSHLNSPNVDSILLLWGHRKMHLQCRPSEHCAHKSRQALPSSPCTTSPCLCSGNLVCPPCRAKACRAAPICFPGDPHISLLSAFPTHRLALLHFMAVNAASCSSAALKDAFFGAQCILDASSKLA